ncbi:MAG: glycosyltransferase family 39 protein, partial [bacterium]
MKTRSRGLLLAVLFLIPLSVRIAYLIETKPHVIFYKGGAEAGFFEEWAGIRKGLGWKDISPPFREPLYPYLIGLIKIVSTSQNGIRIVQMLLASIVSVLIFLIGERLYGKTQGIIASICFALYSPSIFSSGAVNEGMLATFLLILSFYLLLRRNSPIYAFFSGIVLGLGFLSRFAIGIALVAWIVHLSTQGRLIARKTVLPLIIGSLIPIAFYQTFLLRSSGHCLFPTRSGWQAFLGAQGNTIPGDFLPAKIKMEGRDVTVNVASDLLRGQADARRIAKIETGTDLRERKINLHWIKRAAESPKKNSLQAYLRRLGFLFGPYAPPSEFDSRFVGDYARILKIGIWLVPLIIPLGLMGVALNRNRKFVGLVTFVGIYGLMNPVLIVTDIDKLPLAAILMVPAGAFCLAFYALFSKGLTTRGIYLAAITIALVIA